MGVVAAGMVRRGEVFLVNLNPTRGAETRKARPCVVVSPDELNASLHTYLIAPLTSGGHPYPYRVPCRFGERAGQIVLDQVRAVDRSRLFRRLGHLTPATLGKVLGVLQEMFAP